MADSLALKRSRARLFGVMVMAIIILTVLITLSLLWNYQLVSKQVFKLAKKEALTIFKKDIAFRLSNSLKYGFPEDKSGEVTVSTKKTDKAYELTVMDNGIGMPDGLDWKNSKSLGLKLVRTLVENQLDGSIGMESNNGTKFTINFNIDT